MRTSTKALIGAGLVMAATVGGFFAYLAHANPREYGPARGRFLERLAQLGVTDEQKTQVKDILRNHQPTAEPLLKQFVAERRALRDLVHAETVDEKAIRAQAAKVASVGADLAVERAHVAHEIRGVLTPEQIDKLKQMKVDADTRIDDGLARIAKHIAED